MNQIKIVNLTAHDISIVRPDGTTLIVKTNGSVARVATETEKIEPWAGLDIEFFSQIEGEVTGLPEPGYRTLFLVSLAVRKAVPTRFDVVSPGELVRDEKGRPVGCRGLVTNF